MGIFEAWLFGCLTGIVLGIMAAICFILAAFND
jgi:hypothetical protein